MAQNNWLNEIGKSLKADPKKTGALSILALLLGLLVAKQFMGNHGQPDSAGAAMVGPALETAVPSKTASGLASGRTLNVNADALQKWADAPPVPISRNLFAVRIDYFPLDGTRTTQNGPDNEGFWSQLEKSMSVRTDERQRRDNQVANYKLEAEKLKVESTMPGATPRAMIDGQLVGEGSIVANFRVTKIEARRVIIEREGIMLEIQMK